MKKVYAKEEYCVGCRLCEVHCVVAHSKYPNDIIKAFKKDTNRPLPRVIVEEERPVSFALQCRHCDYAYCTKACITGAMRKDPVTGIVTNDEERCVGCWTCILACPFGAIKRDESGHKVASKCDLCSQTALTPACVEHCPNGALLFEERDN
ncbi:4Fe-4S dicluster domain-containing protein [Zhaonella formicivorans]|jgi:carbon-monoxide dehydrogenase iron sulfur subunit|uniref:4Fe-4S dicluster domain-containing protein n=1 Tax=Zhaonella formicivorans TaxID=2528593 RepID=UPI0010F13EC7|nr:4Fe-4S dicluster domain-containing protein [Zhaonella formicivorans]